MLIGKLRPSQYPFPNCVSKILVAKWVHVQDLHLEEKSPKAWKGKGTMNAQKVELQVQVEEGQIQIEKKQLNSGKMRIQTATSDRKTRSGGFKPQSAHPSTGFGTVYPLEIAGQTSRQGLSAPPPDP